jgi:hypothetical protein
MRRLHRSSFFPWLDSPSGLRPPRCRGFEIALRFTTIGRNPLAEWSASRRDLYLIKHNTQKETAIGEIWIRNPSKRAALHRAATGICRHNHIRENLARRSQMRETCCKPNKTLSFLRYISDMCCTKEGFHVCLKWNNNWVYICVMSLWILMKHKQIDERRPCGGARIIWQAVT